MLVLHEDAAGEEAGFGLVVLSSGFQNINPLQKRSKYISLTFCGWFLAFTQCGAGSGGLALKVGWLGSL